MFLGRAASGTPGSPGGVCCGPGILATTHRAPLLSKFSQGQTRGPGGGVSQDGFGDLANLCGHTNGSEEFNDVRDHVEFMFLLPGYLKFCLQIHPRASWRPSLLLELQICTSCH